MYRDGIGSSSGFSTGEGGGLGEPSRELRLDPVWIRNEERKGGIE